VLNHSLLVNDEQSSQSNTLPKEHSDLESNKQKHNMEKKDSTGEESGEEYPVVEKKNLARDQNTKGL